MIDINLIRNETDKVKKGVALKGSKADIDKVLSLDERRRELTVKVDNLRQQRNEAASNKDIELGKKVKQELALLEAELEKANKEYKEELMTIPNLPDSASPQGKGEDDNVEVKIVGEKPEFGFTPKDHVEIGKNLEIIDFERGAKVSGSGFYYLKNEGALLEIALVSYGLHFLQSRGFMPIITPDLARERFYLGTGYAPKGDEAQTYKIEDADLGLIATAEVTIAGYHADEILDGKTLPKLYGGYSHCFRQESGAYGKYSKGLYRVHQFTKVEMFAYTKAEESKKTHEKFLALEEEFWQSLGISYRVLEMCTGDLGSQAARKFDLEAWMPGRGDWGEVTSTSNTTDYQARNLNIRYKDEEGVKFAHMLNGTLVATSRGIIAILENFQQADGTVRIPEVLVPYMGGVSEIKVKK